jgi:hypothetical protein
MLCLVITRESVNRTLPNNLDKMFQYTVCCVYKHKTIRELKTVRVR